MATAPSPNDLTRQQLDELDALLQKMLTIPVSTDTPAPAASLPPMAQPPLPPSWRIDPAQPPDGFGSGARSAPQSPPPAPQARAVSLAEFSLDEPPAQSLKFEPPAPPPVPAPQSPPAPKAVKPVAPAVNPPAAPAVKLVQVPVPPPTPTPPVPKPAAKVTPAPLPTPKQAAPAPQPKAVPAPVIPTPVPTPKQAITPVPAAPPVPLLFLPFVALENLFDSICGMFGPPGRLFRSGFFKYLYGFAGLGLVVYTVLRVAQVQEWLTLPIVLPWPK